MLSAPLFLTLCLKLIGLAAVVQKGDSTIHRINLYPLDSAIGSPNSYPLVSDLSDGYAYPTFEHLGAVD